MPFSDQNLIAYLLGDATPKLRRSIEKALADDADLVEHLSELRQLMGHMDSLAGVFEPPGDLVESTMRRIEEQETVGAPQPASLTAITARLSDVRVAGTGRNRLDSLVLCLSLSLLCCLFLPSIISARFHARIIQCAHNLIEMGQMHGSYATNDPEGRLPHAGTDDITGFAGFIPVRVYSSGFPLTPGHLRCPSLIGYERPVTKLVMDSLPTVDEWKQMAITGAVDISVWKQALGGDYAHNLGIIELGQIVAPRYLGRSDFAILADAPVFQGGGEEFIAHDGRGLNILFEDGRVEFIEVPQLSSFWLHVDYPFRNDRDEHAFGLSGDDSSLAPSPFSPFGRNTVQ